MSKSKKVNGYVALAIEQSLSIPDVQKGFGAIIPMDIQKEFLNIMQEKGWILKSDPLPNLFIPTSIDVYLVPRYKFVLSDDGRYCYHYDCITKKTGPCLYLFDA